MIATTRSALTFDPGRTPTVIGMDGYTISQVAERTGFSPSALRFYEQFGLIEPDRTVAGYRTYDDADLERLWFIGRAKRFGLSLDEITEVLALLSDGKCAPVQGRLRDLVDAKIADAQAKAGELVAFTAELRRVSAALDTHTPDGPCDDACGCTSDRAADHQVVSGARLPTGPVPVACTLSADQLSDRLVEWQSTIAGATDRVEVTDGTRLRFDRGVDVGALAALIAAEQDCCRFFTFTLTVGIDEVTLDVTAPADARPMIDTLVGAP
jgi:DNA-binding transcriptional MerR regulator